MTGYQGIKRQLLPLFKGLPIVVGVFFLALFIARNYIRYAENKYQSIAKIKLDDQKYGFSGNNLFSDFDVFSAENKIEAEVEVLKSPMLIGQIIDSLGLHVEVHRVGKLKNTMLYDDCPFEIEFNLANNTYYDRNFSLEISSNKRVKVGMEEGKMYSGKIGEAIQLEHGNITIKLNQALIDDKGYNSSGSYVFKIFSRDALIESIAQKLDVTAVDKDVAVIRVVYKESHPRKVADIINALCEAYILDYTVTKSGAANKTVDFVDEKITEVGLQLAEAELKLEQFKRRENVVNTLQETETGLREMSKLRVQLVNLEMNENAIRQLESYIDNGEYFDETAINFGFGDLLMTELVKKMKLWQDERRDLLNKYTADHEKVKAVDEKIKETRKYIKEGVKQNLRDIESKRDDITNAVEVSSHMFDELPTREKNHQILLRNFRVLEDVYNFLSQKKIEATIASTANLSFHRIIQRATYPKAPVSPNKVLITFVSGLLGLILGITLIYVRKYIRARVLSKSDIQKFSLIPILGVIRKRAAVDEFESLFNNMLIKGVLNNNQVIACSSTLPEEGKSFVSQNLAKAIRNLGYSVALYNYAPHKVGAPHASIPVHSRKKGAKGDELETLKKDYDFIVMDTISTAVDVQGVQAMKMADVTLYIARANHTCMNYIPQPDLLKKEYDLENIYWLLNDAHKATNYSGMYVGRRFQVKKRIGGTLGLFKYWYQTYLKR